MADYKSETNQGECIFCEIAQGKSKIQGVFWEDDEHLAFLSGWPNTKGFTVVLPKKHHRSDVLAMEDEELSKFIIAAKKVSKILTGYFEDVGRVGVMMEGTGVNHAHIKLFPMHGTGYMKRGEWKQFHSNNDKFFDKYEGYFSSNDGPKANEEEIKALAEELKKT